MAKLVVGSRGSKLAAIQTESVVTRIRKKNPHLDIVIKEIVTAGDRDRHTQLNRMSPGIFVKGLEEALLDKRIDLAVHSLKDVPTEIPPELYLAAIPERVDPRDVLVAKATLRELPSGSRIGTDSMRRSIQLARCRPDLVVCGIRGNVDTRLNKVGSGEVDGLITAAAALLRLGREDEIIEYLAEEYFLPSAGQGALVVETRIDDKDIAEIVSPINNLPDWQSVMAERAFLSTLGGGCRTPIAALGTVIDDSLKLEGMVASVDGNKTLRDFEKGSSAYPEELGIRLAKKLLEMGASEFIDEVRGN